MRFWRSLLLLTVIAVAAFAVDGYSALMTQYNSTGDDLHGYAVSPPAGGLNGVQAYDASNHTLVMWGLGSGLSVTSGVLNTASPSKVYTAVTPTLNSAAQLSSTQEVECFYPVNISVTSVLLATSQGTAELKYADDSGFTTNVVLVTSGTQAVGGVASLTNIGTVMLSGKVPVGKYRKIITTTNSGTVSFTALQGQESK